MQQPSNQHQMLVVSVVAALFMVVSLGIGSLFVRFALPASRAPGDELVFCVRIVVGIASAAVIALAAYSAILLVTSYVLTRCRDRDYTEKCLEGFMEWRLIRRVVLAGCKLATRA
jgi:hypothetical protein